MQYLAQSFWEKWKKQYLALLQTRRKWLSSEPDLEQGSIVLLKDDQRNRNEWAMGRVSQVFPSKDNKVRKVGIKVFKKEGFKVFIRPITETIHFLTPEK